MHHVCGALFRRAMGCESNTFGDQKRLCEVEVVMGPLGELEDAGELRGVDYASLGEKIDVKPFWRVGSDHGQNWFKYDEFQQSPLSDWLFTRPDRCAECLDSLEWLETDAQPASRASTP